jgi:hypothetical protein
LPKRVSNVRSRRIFMESPIQQTAWSPSTRDDFFGAYLSTEHAVAAIVEKVHRF